MCSRLVQGNSIEILRELEKASIHAIISDIPYGIGFDDWDILHANRNSAFCGSSPGQEKAGKLFRRRGKPLNGWSAGDKNIPHEYQEWCASWASEWLRVLKPGASCMIFAGRRFAHRCVCALEDAGFTFKDMLAWVKTGAPHRAQRLSRIYAHRNDRENEVSWRGWRVANLRPVFEPVLWFQKPYPVGSTIADNILSHGVGGWNEEALRTYNAHTEPGLINSNVLKVHNEPGDHGFHAAQKPLLLMELLVALVSKEEQIILDPFMGSGTCCVAACKLNRQYIGIDTREENVRIAQARINALKLP